MTPEELATASQAELIQAVRDGIITRQEAILSMAQRWMDMGGLPAEWDPMEEATKWLDRELPQNLFPLTDAYTPPTFPEDKVLDKVPDKIPETFVRDPEEEGRLLNLNIRDAAKDLPGSRFIKGFTEEGEEPWEGPWSGFESQPQMVWDQVMSRIPPGTLSGYGRAALDRMRYPAFATWFTDPYGAEPSSKVGPGDLGMEATTGRLSFRDWLAGGGPGGGQGQIASPQDIFSNLQHIGGLFDVPTRTEDTPGGTKFLTLREENLRDQFAKQNVLAGERDAFDMFKNSYLRTVHPLFRAAAGRVAERKYREHLDQYGGTDPFVRQFAPGAESSFAEYARRSLGGG